MSGFLFWFFVISTHAALCVAVGVVAMLRPEQANLRTETVQAKNGDRSC